MCDAAWDYDTIAEVPESAEAILWRTGGRFLLGNPPDPLSQMNRDICSPSGFDVYGELQEFFRKDMVRIGIISHFDKKQVSN